MKTIPSLLSAVMLFAFALPAGAGAAESLAPAIVSSSEAALEPVGTGRYHKLGFSIYQASLWAPDGVYARNKTCALQLHYLRSLSKETVVDAVMDDIRAQKTADAETLEKWQAFLTDMLPAIEKGDEIVGLATPGKPSKVFLNGQQIATISDMQLSKAFFNIWLGNVADQNLRAQLVSQR